MNFQADELMKLVATQETKKPKFRDIDLCLDMIRAHREKIHSLRRKIRELEACIEEKDLLLAQEREVKNSVTKSLYRFEAYR